MSLLGAVAKAAKIAREADEAEKTGPSKTSSSKDSSSVAKAEPASNFWVMVTGQIEGADFPGIDNLFCKFAFTYGPDWTFVEGQDEGITQTCEKIGGVSQNFVWNFPLNIRCVDLDRAAFPICATAAAAARFASPFLVN